MEGKTKALKVCLSIFIGYHLAAVMLMPISSSLLGRKLGWLFIPYASTLGFNTTWQFFSPGPTPMFFIEYEPEFADDTGRPVAQPIPYPPPRRPFSWDDGWNRRLFGMRFFSLNGDLMERFFVPFLCRQAPGAQAIYVQSVFEKIEDLEKAGIWTEFVDAKERINLPRQRYSCPLQGKTG